MYSCASIAPVRLLLAGMKEVTRTWKVLSGVVQAQKKYENGLLVMIAVGWAKGTHGARLLYDPLNHSTLFHCYWFAPVIVCVLYVPFNQAFKKNHSPQSVTHRVS